jgi:hypothetical protein
MSSPEDRARTLAIAQDFGAEALELNRQLVAANPVDAASRTRLGRCYLEAGRLDEAEAEYREVLRLDPKNRIAAGGLEALERKRHQGDVTVEAVKARRAERSHREREPAPRRPTGSPSSASLGPVPAVFNGFEPRDFRELRTIARSEVQARFGPRVVDLVKRVNALQSSAEIAAIREPGRRQLFRLSRAEVHAQNDQWFVFNAGARWEPQFNIGMYAGAAGDWLRIGLGFDLSDSGRDADAESGVAQVREYFRRFQAVLESGRRSLFLGWMIKENGLIEYNRPGPRLDLRDAVKAGEFLSGADRAQSEWVFLGKWLSPAQAEDAALLAEPVALVRTIDRVFAGLLPLWRAVRGE